MDRPPELCGLFYIFDGYEQKIVAEAFCDTKTFISVFYQKILKFAKSKSEDEDFIDDWCWDTYNKDCAALEDKDLVLKGIFINKVKSPIIENFIANKNSTRAFVRIN